MVAVVLFHADVPGVGGGFIGVDVFFVISGFLITGLLWREVSTTGTVGLRRLYGARARRLLPASAAVGVVTLIDSAVLLPPLLVRPAIGDGIASALYISKYWFASEGVNYFASHLPPSPFQHYSSLGIEEQFYLVWPALIIGTTWADRLVRLRTRAQTTDGRHRLGDEGGSGRRFACRDVESGLPADRRTAALAAGDHGQGGLPINGRTPHQPPLSVAWLSTFDTASNGAVRSWPGYAPSTRG